MKTRSYDTSLHAGFRNKRDYLAMDRADVLVDEHASGRTNMVVD